MIKDRRSRKERNSLGRVLLAGNAMFGEFMLGLFALAWGVWLLLPVDSFTTSIMYYSLNRMLPESTWGLLMLSLGGLQLNALFLNSKAVRRFSSVLGVLIWAFVAILFAFDSPANPGVVSYFLIAVYSAINYVRLTWSQE